MGDWYVIANIPTWPEREAFNAVETYSLREDGRIATRFRYRHGSFEAPVNTMHPVGTVRPGAQITLDGSGSVALVGRNIVSYRWTQDSGPQAITIPDDTQDQTSFALPAAVEGRWVFRLTVQDDIGDEGSDVVAVVAANPPPAPGGGGGALGWAWGAGLWAWVLGLALGWRRGRPQGTRGTGFARPQGASPSQRRRRASEGEAA